MLDNLFIKQYNKNNVKKRYIYAKKQRKKYG